MSDQNEQASQQNTLHQQQQQAAQQQAFLQHQYPVQYVQQPLVQSQVVAQPISIAGGHQILQSGLVGTQYAPQYIGSQQVVGGQVLHQSGVQVSSVPVTTTIQREVVKGESRIEYVPYEKTIIEYEAVQRVEYIPKEKKVTDYYAVEYQTEYIPQVYQDRYIEYIPQERVQERVEYQAIEKQVVHQPAQEVSQVYVSQVPIAQQLTSSQVHVLPTQTVVSGGQAVLGSQSVAYQQGQTLSYQQGQALSYQPLQQSVSYQPVQQSVVYSSPVQQQLLNGSVYRSNVVSNVTTLPQKPVQQPAKKEEKGFLERIFE